MRRHKCDILNVEWATGSRDTNIIEPVLSYLEIKYGLKIVRTSYEDYLWKLIHYNPKMLVLSNYLGAYENFHITKQAHLMGIKTVSLISEGNVTDGKRAEGFFWGWNRKKENVLDLFLVWSERSKDLFLNNVKEARDFNIKVSGGTGFDRYKILPHMMKIDFLKKYKRREKRVIGIASWGFQNLEYPKKKPDGEMYRSIEEWKYLTDTRIRINKLYDEFISNHPNDLFILKYHPSCYGKKEQTEFVGLEKYKNVIEIFLEEEISELIHVCDFWLVFDSTTALEAWLLNKKTLFVNPQGGMFHRSNMVDGSPEIKSLEDLEKQYEVFYAEGTFEGFEEKQDIRDKIIEDTIQYADGKNHARAAEYIIDEYSSESRTRMIRFSKENAIVLLKEVKWHILTHTFLKRTKVRGMKGYQELYSRFKPSERMNEVKKYTQAIKELNQF